MSLFKTFDRWSWSQLSSYRTCPFQARLKYVEREPEPPQPDDAPNLRGTRIHKNAEDFVLGTEPVLAKDLAPFEVQMHDLRNLKAERPESVLLEQSYYLDQNWRPTNKANCWFKWKPDVHVTDAINLIIDHKTGKKYGNEVKHYAQVELYAVGAFCIDSGYDSYLAELWYIDQKDITPHEFRPEQLEKARARLDVEVTHMMNDKIHTPRPNRMSCKWCPYSPRGTGVCPVGV